MPITKFLPIAVFAFFTVIFAIATISEEDKEPFFSQGDKVRELPKFSLPSIFEGYMGLNYNDFSGGYSLINVFASWCVTCIAEHPTLLDISKSNKLPIYGIAWKDSDEKTRAWLDKLGNPYTKIGADKTGKVVLDLGISGAPETFLVNKDAQIIYHHVGVLTKDIFETDIIPLIQ